MGKVIVNEKKVSDKKQISKDIEKKIKILFTEKVEKLLLNTHSFEKHSLYQY